MNISMFQTGGCWRGLYDPGVPYDVNDIVHYNRHAYKLTKRQPPATPYSQSGWVGTGPGPPPGPWFYKGYYSPYTGYSMNDSVTFMGLGFYTVIAIAVVTPENNSWWELVLQLPVPSDLTASEAEEVSSTTTGDATGTRKYWFGQEWDLEKVGDRGVKLKKVYQNCNCNCNCVCACDCAANQPNCGNCSYDAGDGNACNCACLFQSDCNYNSGNCNCSPNCADGNCYF